MTTAEAISARIATRAKARSEADAAEYRQLVAAVASGQDVDEDVAGRLLAYLKIDDQQFRRDVDLLTRRRAAKADVEAGEAIKADRIKAGEKLVACDDAHRAKVQKLEAEHAVKRAALKFEYDRLMSVERAGGAARVELMNGGLRLPETVEAMDALQVEINNSNRAAGFACDPNRQAEHNEQLARLNAKMQELRAASLLVE